MGGWWVVDGKGDKAKITVGDGQPSNGVIPRYQRRAFAEMTPASEISANGADASLPQSALAE